MRPIVRYSVDPLKEVAALTTGFAALRARLVQRMVDLDTERERLVMALLQVEEMQARADQHKGDARRSDNEGKGNG